jgi:hypothetical protein
VARTFERFPGTVAGDIAYQRRGADDDRAGLVIRRLLLELHEQPLKAAEPVAAVVDRSPSGRPRSWKSCRISGAIGAAPEASQSA